MAAVTTDGKGLPTCKTKTGVREKQGRSYIQCGCQSM